MKYLFVMLLTALFTADVSATPTPRKLSYFRRNDNATILELIAQYNQYKLQTDQAEQLKVKLLGEMKSKKIAIENKIGFTNGSSTSLDVAKSEPIPSSTVQAYSILTPTGSAVVFVYNGATTKTVSLNSTSTSAGPKSAASSPAPYSVVTATGPATTVVSQGSTMTTSLTSTSTITPAPAPANTVTVLTATGSLIVLASQGTTSTVTLNATTTSV